MNTNFGGGLDYGLENGPLLGAGEMSPAGFQDYLTNPKMDYVYIDREAQYDTKSFWESVADTTSNTVDQTTGFVWDTASGTWDTIKSGATSVANAVTEGGEKILGAAGDIFDSILMRGLLILAVLVIALVVLGKTGVLRDIGKILGPV